MTNKLPAVACLVMAAAWAPGAAGQEEVKVRVDPGLEVGIFAREPMVKDPVAFAIDPTTGRIAVCESFRQSHGVEDNRSSPYWLLDDLAARTVEDRRAYMLKWADRFEGGARWFTEMDDQVRMLTDTDGDGRADEVKLLNDGFNDVVDGTGSGALWVEGDLWFTNIPHLWRIKDTDGDGAPDTRESMYEGFGVRTALRGHDMHGLTHGPDGRIYWSIGDRGYNVRLPDGTTLVDPQSGAVFRCERDGSGLEVFATGLRNPQEIAFDRFGNLFTGDNNSDAGDRARMVYVVEGGDTGWNMSFQTLTGTNERGPWNQEGIWWTERPLDPAWTIPPLAHVGAGPSGFAFYPGVGLPERYEDHLFLCDFRGADANSSVRAFTMVPDGAGFRVENEHEFMTNVLATDVAFGPDGRVYVSDWGGGWNSNGTGQIYTAWDPELVETDSVREVSRILSEGFDDLFDEDLVDLLAHPHRDVRLFAQYELADRGEDTTNLLEETAVGGFDFNSRLHAAWALEMQARHSDLDPVDPDHPGSRLLPLLEDRDPEIRAQGARLVGTAGLTSASEPLRALLFDENDRVRYFAMMSLGRLGVAQAAPEIAGVLAENEDRDPFIRHAGVMAFEWLGEADRDLLNELAVHSSRSVRIAALLAMRRLEDPLISRFLDDPDPLIVLEAARAINDVPIRSEWPALADRLARFTSVPGTSSPSVADPPEVIREVWLDRAGLAGSDLLSSEIFDTAPDRVESLDRFDAPRGDADRFASRLRTNLVAPMSGEYVFWISSDDDSTLTLDLGRDGDPRMIAGVSGWVAPDDWERAPGQRSEPVFIRAGETIVLEARHLDGNGQDHVAVGWMLPDGTVERPIGGGGTEVDPWVEPFLRRCVNAAVRVGSTRHANLLSDVAGNSSLPDGIRLDAMEGLSEWSAPDPRDRVIGNWRPVGVEDRDLEGWRTILASRLPGLVEEGTGRIRQMALELSSRESIPLDGEINFTILGDSEATSGERIAALRQIARDGSERLDDSIENALASSDPRLRSEARDLLMRRSPERGIAALVDAIEGGTVQERQDAIRSLGESGDPGADGHVAALLELMPDRIDPDLRLDVLLAGRDVERPATATILERIERDVSTLPHGYLSLALSGGDPVAGASIVREHPGAQCLRCHRVSGLGGEAGPSLDGVAKRLSAEHLLQSIVEPSAVIVEGYGDASAMPAMHGILDVEQIRDVVAFLRTLENDDSDRGH